MKTNIVKYFAIIAACILTTSVSGVDQPPFLLRVCMDRSTTPATITVSFIPSSDGCGSFVKYVLYGRESVAQPFVWVADHTVLASSSFSTPVSSKKKWEFFMTVHYACNGTDTFISNMILVDDDPPAEHEPDSVSVDLATQQLIAGWIKAPEPDVMGYSMFKVDPSNGNNILIHTKNQTKDSFNTGIFDPKTSGNRFALAVFDSCRNEGIISNYHSPVLLSQGTVDPCKKEIILNWSSYVGWATEESYLYVKDDVGNTWQLVATIAEVPGPHSYAFSMPFQNRTYSFYVRSKKLGSTITSSSNMISYFFAGPVTPAFNEIGHVSVLDNQSIEITGLFDKTASVSQAKLQRSLNSFTWNTIYTTTVGNFIHVDAGILPAANIYKYRILLVDACGDSIAASLIHNSIQLQLIGSSFTWNDYIGWPNSPTPGSLHNKNRIATTYTDLGSSGNSYSVADTTDGMCYRVKAVKMVSGSPVDQAWSNQICLFAFDTTLIPNTFNPEGKNSVFKIVNPNLAPGESNMRIYSRWGQKLAETDALIGWDGKDRDGNIYMGGVYIYRIDITRDIKREQFNGVLYLIR